MTPAFRRPCAEAPPDLIRRYESLSTPVLLSPVRHLLPPAPARILDIGAGTGRDAAWLAARGHRIAAAEPSDALRAAGRALHRGIGWTPDSLPRLARLRGRGVRFDLILICAVWHRLAPAGRRAAFPVLRALCAPGGRVVLSLRRPPEPAAPSAALPGAAEAGFRLLLRREAPSRQPANRAAGVRWTWLVLAAPGRMDPGPARR